VLTEPQLQRYSRQLLLPEIGGAGQERLLASRVEVRGAGAAADSLRGYLAAAGVGLGTGGLLVLSPQDACGAHWVLDDVGVAWAPSGGTCGDCLAATLTAVARPPDWVLAAVAQAAGALAASQILLCLAGHAPESAGSYLAWPRASRQRPVARPGCRCA
jgi:hypothetical protein